MQDAAFVVLLEGEASFVQQLGNALQDPVWFLWLGRKSCVPSAPIFGGIFTSEDAAVSHMLGVPLTACTHEREVTLFEQGTDSYPDQPVCFDSARRAAGLRRVRRFLAKE